MKKSGSFLAVYALEQLGIKFTFGIPGVHNTELYDALDKSDKIKPILVTHEGGASFMADGVSRTSDTVGTLMIVPAAGTTHAMSGIGEAYLDGIPMLVISGGTRRDSGKAYQLHQLDLSKILDGITKKYILIEKHEDIIPKLYEAYDLAISGEPGPVYVEIPIELQLFTGDVDTLPKYQVRTTKSEFSQAQIKKAVDLLCKSENPGLFMGWGSLNGSEYIKPIAEKLGAPVSTTLQGLSAFPSNHPLHAGVGFGPASVPAAQEAFKNCDCMLAIGVRFSELATGSYGAPVPENLIHGDINSKVFNRNYPATVTLEGDSEDILKAIWKELDNRKCDTIRKVEVTGERIQTSKQKYFDEWTKSKNPEKVSPGHFYNYLRKEFPDDGIMVVDDGKHTFLTAELFPIYRTKGFISPTDFNCMGFCVPAAIGAKLANPDKTINAIVGDGAFTMTGMEMITATANGLGIVYYVFNDGELGQISQFQKIPLNRKTCTILPGVNFEGVAIATGAKYLKMSNDSEIESVIDEANNLIKQNVPVVVDVNIDYSKKTFLTKGVIKANLSRFPIDQKIRFIARAAKRHLVG